MAWAEVCPVRKPCPLPCLQGRVGVGSLFAQEIKGFTPSQASPCKQGEEQAKGLNRL
jgi:hypothetical protein